MINGLNWEGEQHECTGVRSQEKGLFISCRAHVSIPARAVSSLPVWTTLEDTSSSCTRSLLLFSALFALQESSKLGTQGSMLTLSRPLGTQ